MGLSHARGKIAQQATNATFFFQGVIATTQIPRIPELIDNLNVSFTVWGLIIGLAGLGSLAGLTVANRFIVRYGARQMVLAGSLAVATLIIALPWITNPWLFFGVQLISGFCGSVMGIALNAQAVVLQKLLNKVVIGKFHASWSIGATASAAVAGLLAGFMPLWLHLTIVPALAAVAFLWTTRQMLTAEEIGHANEKKSEKRIPFFKSPPQVWLLTAGLFTGVFPELCMMDWSAVFGQKAIGLSAGLGAIPYTIFSGAMIVGRLSIGRLTKRFHISELSKWGGIFGSVTLGLGVILGPILAQTDKILALVVLSILWGITGLGLAPMVPSFFTGAGLVKGLTTAQTMARMSLVNSIIIMGAKILMGALAQNVSIVVAFVFPTAMMFVAGYIAHLVAKRAKRADAVAMAFPPTGPISIIE